MSKFLNKEDYYKTDEGRFQIMMQDKESQYLDIQAAKDSHVGQLSKVIRYGWEISDEMGVMMFLHKNELRIDHRYQRPSNLRKVLELASNWSWISFGIITVGLRKDEPGYWVIDGQHRVLAARKRSDIEALPCMIFEIKSICEEADSFLKSNSGRNAVSSIQKFKALIVSKDSHAIYLSNILDKHGITISENPSNGLSTKCIKLLSKRSIENKKVFEYVLKIVTELCKDSVIYEKLFDGLFYIYANINCIGDLRLRNKILSIGSSRLILSAQKASMFYAKGGAKIYASGMLLEINKGLKESNRYSFEGEVLK